jgi:hypothetical protein
MPHYAQSSLLGLIGHGAHTAYKTVTEAWIGMGCAREAERLSYLSDLELARLGIKRDQIFQHAFAPLLRG